jgi:outer membrane protein TolC
MKVLEGWKMRLKIFNLFLFIIFNNYILAQDILSNEQQKKIQYSYDKIEEDTSRLSKNWINSITYSYAQTNSDTNIKSKQSLISISQPIFKSGGIYNSIKYASALKISNKIAVTLQEKELIKKAFTILFNIYKNDLLIKKQKLLLANNLIELKQKKESVLNGLLDISFLNNAIVQNNREKEKLLDLEFLNTQLTNEFNNLTSKTPQEFKLPVLKLINNSQYISNNIYIKQTKATSDTKQYLKKVVEAKYLPTINLNYNYSYEHIINRKNQNYGFNIIIPFNISSKNDISSSKIDFLQSKIQEKITTKIEENFLKTKLAKLDMLDKKIDLIKNNIKYFQELLIQMKEQEAVGLKIKDDVTILNNSKKEETLNMKIFSIDRQIELLELYAHIF